MVTYAEDNPFPSVLFAETEAVDLAANPAAGQRRLIVDPSDHLLYLVDPSGVATVVGAGASFATPSIALGSSAAGGAAGTVIRSDATIAAFDATAPVTQAFSDSAATGSAAFAARRDHKHGMPASPGGGSLTSTSQVLGSVVTLNTSTFTDILSLGSLAAGTWLVIGTFTCHSSGTSVTGIQIWDGTTIYASADTVTNASSSPEEAVITIAVLITLGGSATIKASGKNQVAASTVVATTTFVGGIASATNLLAVKIA